jgi:sigma-E factor negative regulatory protein RseC
MLIERGVVTTKENNLITVTCRSRVDCARCAQGKGCGGGILARWLGNRQFQVQAWFNPELHNPEIGNLVEISLPATRVVRLAAIMYGLPLVILVVALLIHVQLFPDANDLSNILLSILSLVLGFKAAAILISLANKSGQLLPGLHSVKLQSPQENQLCKSITTS